MGCKFLLIFSALECLMKFVYSDEIVREAYFISEVLSPPRQEGGCWAGLQYLAQDGKCKFCLGHGESCSSDLECCRGQMTCLNNLTLGLQTCTCIQGLNPDPLNHMCSTSTRMFQFALGLGAAILFLIFASLAHFCKVPSEKSSLITSPEVTRVSFSDHVDVPRGIIPSAPPSEHPPSYHQIYPILADYKGDKQDELFGRIQHV